MPERWSPALPDQIEPIIGYRAWNFSIEAGASELHSIGGFGREWERVTQGWVTAFCAVCGSNPWHRAPVEVCSCGFYAMKTMGPELTGFAAPLQKYRKVAKHVSAGVVFGRVELAGKVIEHEHGYRAERARIAELIPMQGWERPVMILADRLGVPTAKAVRVRPRGRDRVPHAQAPRSRKRVVVPAPEPRDWSPWAVVLGILWVLSKVLQLGRP